MAAALAAVLLAGCSGDGGVTPPDAGRAALAADAHAGAGPSAPERKRAGNPLPLDSHASAVIPRWFVPRPLPEQPRFTPHWYTPSVDPLFRRRGGAAPAGREPATAGAPDSSDLADATHPPADPAIAALAARGEKAPELKDYHVIAPSMAGVASWYGPGFHGKATANGEVYDQYRMTAAHPNLPMGTIIRVENQANGAVVWVRVNDRGPYAKGRVLDLSLAAAQRLGMVREGTAPVRIDVLRWPQSTDYELGLRAYTQYVVQVAAYPDPDTAASVQRDLQQRFDWARFELDPRPNGALSVIAGPFDDNAAAQRVARRLQQSGVNSLVRRYRK